MGNISIHRRVCCLAGEILENRCLLSTSTTPVSGGVDRTAIMLGEEVQIPHWVPDHEVAKARASYAALSPGPTDVDYTIQHLAMDIEANSLIDLDEHYSSPQLGAFDGSGYSIAILDTGFDLDHPVFGLDDNEDGYGDRIVADVDFVNDDGVASAGSTGDSRSHGTHVASIAAGLSNSYDGVARGANFVLLQIMNDNGGGHYGWVDEALRWVAANASIYNIVAVNMSIGFNELFQSSDDPEILAKQPAEVIGILNDIRVVMVAAAGNSYDCFRNDDIDKTSMLGIMYPAADQRVISVGATFDAFVGNFNGSKSWGCPGDSPEPNVTRTTHRSGPDRITAFTNRDPDMLDTYAPGSEILGAVVDGGYESWDGTSMATPYVAGMAVIAQQIAIQNTGSGLNADDFRAYLDTSGVLVNDGDDENDTVDHYGHNHYRLDADDLSQAVYSATGGGAFAAPEEAIAATSVDETFKVVYKEMPSGRPEQPYPRVLDAMTDIILREIIPLDPRVGTFDLNYNAVFHLMNDVASRMIGSGGGTEGDFDDTEMSTLVDSPVPGWFV